MVPNVQLNLHTHLEGSVRPATAAALAHRLGIPAPAPGWEAALRMKDPGDLTAFLAHVAAAYPLLGTREALHQVAKEAVEDAAADGQSYIELRLGPGTHARAGLSVHDVLAAACAGVEEAKNMSGIHAGVVACMLRHEPDGVIEEVANAAIKLSGEGVVGIDVAGDEILFPALQRYVPHYARAAAAGLGLTVHAAEAGPASAAKNAVELLGVSRIGHGSHLADDAAALSWVKDHGIVLEVCPSSNVLTGAATSIAAHPIHTFIDNGVRIVLGDDDPITTGVRLSGERQILIEQGRMDHDVIRTFHRTAVDVAFCSDWERAHLRALLGDT